MVGRARTKVVDAFRDPQKAAERRRRRTAEVASRRASLVAAADDATSNFSDVVQTCIREELRGQEPLSVRLFSIYHQASGNALPLIAVLTESHLHVLLLGRRDLERSTKAECFWHGSVHLSEITSMSTEGSKLTVSFANGHYVLLGYPERNHPDVTRKFVQEIEEQMGRSRRGGLGTAAETVDAIKTLTALFNEGIFTAEEWARAKQLFLGRAPEKHETVEKMLRSLSHLYHAGVLSEGEFNLKKWDILSKP